MKEPESYTSAILSAVRNTTLLVPNFMSPKVKKHSGNPGLTSEKYKHRLMRPLALTVAGGLLASTFFTLFVVSCLSIIISGIAEKIKYFITGKIIDEEMLKGWYTGDGKKKTEKNNR